jgi:hypothetical protein
VRDSEKTRIVELIFDGLWDRRRRALHRTLVTFEDVKRAIALGKRDGTVLPETSADNPANFFGDFMRLADPNAAWPDSIKLKRYTALLRPGESEKSHFEFVPYADRQREPFPEDFPVDVNAPVIEIQTLSLPFELRLIGRWDEARLLQVLSTLRVIETHFSLVSDLGIIQIQFVQNNVKLSNSEIDALYIAEYGADRRKAVITCEAKSKGNGKRLVASQIERQVAAAAALNPEDFDLVIPTAVKAAHDGVYFFEFYPVPISGAQGHQSLVVRHQRRYAFKPPIPGLNAPALRKKHSR